MNTKIAFLILSYQQADEIFIRLLNFLCSINGAHVFIHHDKYQQAPTIIGNIPTSDKITILSNSRKTYWSHINNHLATMDLFETAYKHDNYSWFVTLTPSCYPIKSASQIQSFYQNASADAFIDMRIVVKDQFIHPIVDQYIYRDIYSKPWLKIPMLSRNFKPYIKTIYKQRQTNTIPWGPNKFELWTGSNWLSVNRKVVESFANHQFLNEAHPLTAFYNQQANNELQVPCPQEVILQSYIGSNKKFDIDFNSYRFIDWQGAKGWSPNMLDESYFDRLASSNALFARKLSQSKSLKLANLIDKHLL